MHVRVENVHGSCLFIATIKSWNSHKYIQAKWAMWMCVCTLHSVTSSKAKISPVPLNNVHKDVNAEINTNHPNSLMILFYLILVKIDISFSLTILFSFHGCFKIQWNTQNVIDDRTQTIWYGVPRWLWWWIIRSEYKICFS